MPFSTGTAQGALDLIKKVSTHLTNNGWTKVSGQNDTVAASPKAARYWRVLFRGAAGSYRRLQYLTMSATVGGTNLITDATKLSSNQTGPNVLSNLLLNNTSFADTGAIGWNFPWWIQYDFGSATTIREVTLRSDESFQPYNPTLQWSPDGIVWTTLITTPWTPSSVSTLIMSAPDGYVSAVHVSGTVARRGGLANDTDVTVPTELSNDIWVLQGPGYDASRRVYIYMTPRYDLSVTTEWIQCNASIDFDSTLNDWYTSQKGILSRLDRPNYFMMSTEQVTYWIYSNSTRVIVIVKNGTNDYTSLYLGFMKSFTLPDNYQFPLYIGTQGIDLVSMATSSSGYRSFQDPSAGCSYRDWNGNWRVTRNHDTTNGAIDNPFYLSENWVWPNGIGYSGRGTFPRQTVGDHADFDSHYLDRIDPITSGDLPLIPCMVMNNQYGAIGSLDGVFAIPKGAVLSPEQTLTIGSDTYRVFQNRAKTAGNHYFAILEV